MVKRAIRSFLLGVAGLVLAAPAFSVTAPRDGGALPEAFFRVREKDRSAFTHRRAWVEKTRRLSEERLARPFVGDAGAPAPAASTAVSGTLRVPVLPGYFSNQATVPVSAASLQSQLFTNNPTGTISQYYTEVSYGQFTITGDVQTWVHVSNTGAYYAGGSNGTEPGNAETGEFIREILDARDPTVDFGIYDNDGPDGIANSGDDDGFVDAAVFVHSLTGGECGNANILSHSWVYSAWTGAAYTTNDARAGGGNIRIDEYIITPALNCGAVAPYDASEYIDIGVFCHELGHALGLPDLYDLNGGGFGIGDWGLMGSGNWNTPEMPAHPEAWTRMQLGWVVPVDIGWQATPVVIANIGENPVAYRLPFTDERFRRSSECVIAGAYSLFCGLTAAEADTRNWAAAGPGYGPNWYETIERDFTYSGSGSVTFQYKFKYDLEPNYDFAYALVEVNGTETPLATYNGTGNGSAGHTLDAALAPLAGTGGTYTLKFRVVSDFSFDNADGYEPSVCGALSVDDVSVTGGGVSWASSFETSVDGWHQDPAENPASEYWLVENRRRVGFDQNLHGEGLLVWHVDDEVALSPFLGNAGTGGTVRGLVLEEAEGVFDLNGVGANRGEPADVFPGTANNTGFGSLTTPGSTDNTARATRIEITGISPAAAVMSATLRAGDASPLAASLSPSAIDNDEPAVQVTVSGSRLRHGAAFRFVFSGGAAAAPGATMDPTDIVPAALEWVDENTLRGTINAYVKTPGLWHLEVTNPDGQVALLENALTVNPILATRLVSADIGVTGDGVRLRYLLAEREPGEVVRLYRSNRPDGGFVVLAEDLPAVRGGDYVYLDRSVEAGRTYFYLLESRLPEGEVRELHRGVAVVPARDLVLEQNHPNPFNPRTSIRFYLPARSPVQLDVFDVKGALVRRLATGAYDAGSHTVEWDGTGADGAPAASGMYVYRLVTAGRTTSRKMMLLK